MDLRISELYRWDGSVGRRAYAAIGACAFLLKHGLDRLVAGAGFGREWGLLAYLDPLATVKNPNALSRADAGFYLTMLALSLPFLWVGLTLTLRRLRAVALPGWGVVLFFLPFVNLIFFAALLVLPDVQGGPVLAERPGWFKAFFNRVIPLDPWPAASMAVLLPLPVSIATIWLGVTTFESYGWSLFVAVPFCIGLVSVLLFGYRRPRAFFPCMGVACVATLAIGIGLIGLAREGIICVLMASPLALIIALVGAVIGYKIQNQPRLEEKGWNLLLVLMALCPLLMGAEALDPPDPPVFEVRSAIVVNAPPERVWERVVAFADLPEPEEWLFRAGIAYPMRAEIHGHGVGAERRCLFSTGAFVEPIEVWDEPRLLKFSVTSNPPPMEEWTPYHQIRPRHLDGFLASRGGQFRLIRLPDGGTLLEGTTWYQHHMWPAWYWQIWSDAIIHRIHLRVLRHIQRLSE